VGMINPPVGIWVMVAAVIVAVVVMLFLANPLAEFVNKHPTVKMLALAFLLLIGMSLVAEGFHFHIEKGFIYAAMGFSVFVEVLNLLAARRRQQKQKSTPSRSNCTAATPKTAGSPNLRPETNRAAPTTSAAARFYACVARTRKAGR